MNCIFCKIIQGEIPSYKIYEDDYVYAFLDINPDSAGHTLVIPKQHFQDLDDIECATLNHIMKICKILKNKLEEKLKCDGLTIIQNNGLIQEVKHFHFHLKPYYKDCNNLKIEEVYAMLT